MKNLLTKILMMGIFGSLVTAQTDVSGVISSNTTWSFINSPYNVTDNILVSSGITLIVEAGVTVKFNTNKSIQVDGELIAQGTNNNKITFTSNQNSPSVGDWGGIKFSSTSIDAIFGSGEVYTSGSVLQHCIIEYGGSTLDASLVISAAHPYIDNSVIRNSESKGVLATNLGANPGLFLITNCIIRNNKNTGINISVPNVNLTIKIKNNIIVNNNSMSFAGGIELHMGGATPAADAYITNNIIAENIGYKTGGIKLSYWTFSEVSVFNNVFFDNKVNFVPASSASGNSVGYAISINRSNTNYGTSIASHIGLNTFLNHQEGPLLYFYNNSNDTYLDVNLNGNNYINNQSDYILYNNTGAAIDAESNYWGGTTDLEIPSLIYDWNDDINLGIIDYDPVSSFPNTTAPISPPRNVTVSNASGNYVISWNANLESDVAGYKIYYGGYTGYSFSNVIDVGNVTSYDMMAAGLTSYSDSVIAVTAYDINKDGIDDQVEGYESWFSILPYTGPVWYVSKSGSDGNDGSEDSPFITIQKGIDSALSGDTIRVGAHIIDPAPTSSHYYSKITITDKNLTILSDSGADSTKIDGGGTERPVTITGTSAVTLKGFSITNGLSDNGGGINISSTGTILLENLNIYSNQVTDDGGGIYTSENSNVTIISCKVHSNVCVSNGGGIVSRGNNIIQNSLIYNNESQSDDGGILATKPLILINSVVAYNFIPDGRYAPGLGIVTGLDSLLLFNNIFYHNYRGQSYDMGSEDAINLGDGRLVAYNNYFQEGDNNLIISRGSGNIFSDTSPLISETSASDDYSLKNTSNAIGAGISSVTLNGTTYSSPTTDYNGAARPQPVGTNPDMGAIENSLGVASAKTITVKTDGTGDYTVIQTAISAANDGDTVLVSAGTYVENINFNGKNIVVQGADRETTIIDGNANGTPVVRFQNAETNDAKLIGFTIQNGFTATDELGAGIDVSMSAAPTLDHLIVQNNNAQSGRGGGIRFYFAGTSSILSNLTIRNNISSDMGGGIYSWQSFIDLSNSKIYGNSSEYGSGLSFHGSQGGNNGKPILYCQISNNVGAPVIDGSDIVLVNCSIINNDGLLELYGNSALINTIVGSGHTIDDNGIVNISYSLIQDGISSIDYPFEASLVWGEGNIEADPLFVDPDNGDYHLQLGSPCIDAAHPDLDGDGITWEIDTDDQDPDGSRMDIGYISRSCQVDQCGVCDHDPSNDCIMDCAGAWGGDAELDCADVCEGDAKLDDCGDCNGNNANMNECGVCFAQYSCNPFVLSNERDTISLKVDTLTFTFSVPMDTLTFSAISLTSTEIDNIEFHTSQDADSIRTLTLIINSPLVSRDTLTLTFPSTLQSSFGYPFDGNQDGTTGDGQTITLYTETLADYNHDNAIDFDDMTAFIASWYADDYDKELGPVTGTAPHLIPAFDNAFDIEDIITFMLMWNWANDFIPTPAGRIKDSGIPPNIVLQDGILQLDLSEYLENIAAVRIQLSTSDPKVKVISEGIQSPFDITLLRSWEEDNIYEWNLGNPQGKHFDVVQLCHLETMQKQNLHLVIDYEIISTYGNVLSSGRTALDHIVIPNEYALQQAYPNPFNPVTTLSFGLPIETEVSLSVYNLQGKEVISLIDGNLDAGYHSVVWNADRHSSGVYFVKMIAGEYVNTQKLMLVK